MSSGLSRRRLLATGAGLCLSATAGCTGVLGSDTEPVSIHRLLVENHTTSAHTVHLQLLDAGDLVYWRSIHVPVTDADQEFITGTRLAPGFPTSPGEYVLRARLDDEADWRRIDYSQVTLAEDQCFEVVVTVEDSDTLGFLSSVDVAVCGKPSGP